ncbi:MAG: type II toxin-antitoxin system RelE/ParE family toxin [Oscillospiraceae bacterium]|nr:type II toxin-antitoxin system RelE/ParE family toxin [Oscillospiraceae bacterium]
MEKYELKILPLFEEDMLEAAEYISEVLKNPSAAERLIDETEKAIFKRLDSPMSFPPYKSKKHRDFTYYRIFVGNFTVFYVVNDNVMEVRRFIYSKRNIENII